MTTPSTIGKYVLQKRLGGGHFGEVFLAHDRALACNKAIKLVQIADPSEIMQKLGEAQILDKCRHKHIVQINEANVFNVSGDKILVLDLEYLPEGSLESEMQNRWISAKEACSRIACVLSGLHFAHSNGYLHRDVKPGNVLISGDTTKLSDFGLATTTLNLVGSDQGYLAHCPPEFYDTGETSVLTDVFATGLTLFRIINNIADWRVQLSVLPKVDELIQSGRLTAAIGYEDFVPEKLRRISRKACHPDPGKRYGSALDMKDDLDALRFDIEWHRSSPDNWSGFSSGTIHEIEIVAKRRDFEVVYRKNGRRNNALTSVQPTIYDARAEAARIVAQTTLK